MDPLVRLQNLFDRAVHASTPEEEARTAAILAVRLMHKLGLHPSKSPAPTPARTPQRDPWGPVTDSWPSVAHPRPGKRGKVRKPPAPASNGQVYVKEPVRIRSNFPGICLGCGETFEGGETVWWLKSEGATHAECRGYWNYNGVR
jgi:hypothetical protein